MIKECSVRIVALLFLLWFWFGAISFSQPRPHEERDARHFISLDNRIASAPEETRPADATVVGATAEPWISIEFLGRDPEMVRLWSNMTILGTGSNKKAIDVEWYGTNTNQILLKGSIKFGPMPNAKSAMWSSRIPKIVPTTFTFVVRAGAWQTKKGTTKGTYYFEMCRPLSR